MTDLPLGSTCDGRYVGLSAAERAAAMVDPHIPGCDAPTIAECISCAGRVEQIRRVLAAAAPEIRRSQAIDSMIIAEAVTLLRYALHLRVHGERAPGGSETWGQFDLECEHFLRTFPGGSSRG